MLFNTLRKAKYTYQGDYYGYTTVTSADGLVSNTVYTTSPIIIQFALSTSFIGDIVILTDSKLQLKGHVADITDRNGNPVYVDGEWEIKSTQPIVNAMGVIDGYKYKAKLISGNV
jgi:1-aminocyclopropane-1-carboxylate deaminase/D-cysteine desulfhydrase-like pyridoxal-dependent ACC family enzyme